MKGLCQVGIGLLLLPACSQGSAGEPVWQEGDVIFQTSRSHQSRAIQLATSSRYSHVGVVYADEEGWQVFEAVDPVRSTDLDTWIARGEGGHFALRRLPASSALSSEQGSAMRDLAQQWAGTDYDWGFAWSDDKLYCSELVWKLYARGAGIRLGEPRELRDFDLSHPHVQAKIAERWPLGPPLEEPVVSPQDLFETPVLETVTSGR